MRKLNVRTAVMFMMVFMLAISAGVASATSLSLDNDTTSRNMTYGTNGWETKELFTIGESVGDYTPPGIPDGMGAFELNENTVRLLVNHELLNFRGYDYEVSDGAGGTFTMDGARISYMDFDKHSREIVDSGLAYDTIYDANGDVASDISFLANDLIGFSRFCSAQLVEPTQFGEGRGLEDRVYMAGEEDGGRFNPVGGGEWVLDTASGEIWHAPDMGRGAWENVTEIDTGTTTHIAIILADDSSPFNADDDEEVEAAPLYLYVGEKNPDGDFLERNGMRGGTLYVWVSDTGETTPADFNAAGTLTGSWVPVDNTPNMALADENGANGHDEFGYPTQSNLWRQAEALGAFGFSRPEDVATNPDNGSEFVLASTGVDTFVIDPVTGNGFDTFGTIYTVDTDFSDINNPTASVTIVYDGDADPSRELRSPDNLEWADDGYFLIQEDEAEEDTASGDEVLFGDGAANPNEAGIVRMHAVTGEIARVANIDRTVVLDPSVDPETKAVDVDAGFAGEWETSGIIDVSDLLDELPGSTFLFNVQAHGIEDQEQFNPESRMNDDDLVQGGQINWLHAPPTHGLACGMEFEAEDAHLRGWFEVGIDPANGKEYIFVPGSNPDLENDDNPDRTHRADFCLEVPTDGEYVIMADVFAPDFGDDSLYVEVDGEHIIWDVRLDDNFATDQVNERFGDDPLVFELTAGKHLLSIIHREPNVQLDTVKAVKVGGEEAAEKNFNRVTSFPVCEQLDPTCNIDDETAAEIVAASENGNTLIYTDSPLEAIGFVNISDPSNPIASGTLALSGEPTSVAVSGSYALVGVNTSEDFINVSGHLDVINMGTQSVVASIDLGGQPDSVATSPDGSYAAIVIENERDEDLGEGEPPQAPAGAMVIVEMAGAPADWSATTVQMTGLADLFPEDPEPEYVDINDNNIAVITMQENNYIVLVDLTDGSIVNHFSAGTVSLDQIDTEEEDPAIISPTDSEADIPREPDGVAWIGTDYFATADEGDLFGGSRGFTIFNTDGDVVYTSGNTLEHLAIRLGHYPDGRSGNKGNEPENVEYGIFDGQPLLFVNSERSSLVFVYDVTDPASPEYLQTLPTGVGPEGGLALPDRDLLIVASEVDARGDKIRSVLNIYKRSEGPAQYPTIMSSDRGDGTPIPWSAMSGLAAGEGSMLYAIEDSFYGSNRIFGIDTSQSPALLTTEIAMKDTNGVFAAIPTVALADASVDADDPSRIGVFDEADLAALINDDGTINIDPEGISVASDGGFWVVSEGSGTVGDEGRPINSLNFIFKTDANGVIESVVTLPDEVNAIQLRFGFEGVAEYDGKAYVAFQRAWGDEENPRIGVYDVASASWSFFFYPLDAPESQNGGWVGLSDITALGDGEFIVVERDNQGGPDAAIKRIYSFNVSDLADGDTITKTLERDLMAEGDLSAAGALTYEKIEGLAIMADGSTYIINDNDGVDDNSGETQLINLGGIK